jgi:hypothetical protein
LSGFGMLLSVLSSLRLLMQDRANNAEKRKREQGYVKLEHRNNEYYGGRSVL